MTPHAITWVVIAILAGADAVLSYLVNANHRTLGQLLAENVELNKKVSALEDEVASVSAYQIKMLGEVIAVEKSQESLKDQILKAALDRRLTPRLETKPEEETVARSRSWEVQRRLAEEGQRA